MNNVFFLLLFEGFQEAPNSIFKQTFEGSYTEIDGLTVCVYSEIDKLNGCCVETVVWCYFQDPE